MDRKKIKEELRKVCQIDEKQETKTEWIKGCSKLKVELINWPDEKSLYKAMVNGVLHTWGTNDNQDKWPQMSPETRFEVLNEALNYRALPLVQEIPQFTFSIKGTSRASFDQIVRARVGFVAMAKGVRDNNCKSWGVVVPTEIYENPEKFEEFKNSISLQKETYSKWVSGSKASWQGARSILPMNLEYSFLCSVNFMALKNLCAHRLINTEQEDTVGTIVLMWKALFEKFPLLAAYCQPSEDKAKRNLTVAVNGLSHYLGLLFAGADGDNRWPLDKDQLKGQEVLFNTAAASWPKIEEQTGYHFPTPLEWPKYINYEDLKEIDKERFNN